MFLNRQLIENFGKKYFVFRIFVLVCFNKYNFCRIQICHFLVEIMPASNKKLRFLSSGLIVFLSNGLYSFVYSVAMDVFRPKM